MKAIHNIPKLRDAVKTLLIWIFIEKMLTLKKIKFSNQ